VVGQTLDGRALDPRRQGLKVGDVTQAFNTKVLPGKSSARIRPQTVVAPRRGSQPRRLPREHVVAVPTNLIGLSEQDARTALKAAGLQVGQIVSRNSDAPAGQVSKPTRRPGPRWRSQQGDAVRVQCRR